MPAADKKSRAELTSDRSAEENSIFMVRFTADTVSQRHGRGNNSDYGNGNRGYAGLAAGNNPMPDTVVVALSNPAAASSKLPCADLSQ